MDNVWFVAALWVANAFFMPAHLVQPSVPLADAVAAIGEGSS
jgi:hypothetical protein